MNKNYIILCILILNLILITSCSTKIAVTYLDNDGTILLEEKVKKIENSNAPVPSEKVGYIFIGWKKEELEKKKIIMKPLYEILKYKVVFEDKFGTILKEETVLYNESANSPNVPEIEGYNFIGWDKEFENVTSDLIIKPIYDKKTFKVVFKDESGIILKEETVLYNESATSPNVPEIEGYNFIGWDKEYINIKSDLELIAQYELITYIITFESNGGNEISNIEFTIETEIIELPTPTKEGYNFLGWYEEETFIETIEYRSYNLQAKWEEKVYIVIFKNFDGTILKEELIAYGKAATAPLLELREGYTFIGWDKKFENIVSNLEIQPIYEKNHLRLHLLITITNY